MEFDTQETRKLYYYLCNKYHIHFTIYKPNNEKITSDEMLESTSKFLKQVQGVDLYADLQE